MNAVHSPLRLHLWCRLSLQVAALASSAAMAACQEGTQMMNQAPAGGQIAAPVAAALGSALKAALGEDVRRRITTFTDTPKGLLQNGRLLLAPGTPQRIMIYGDLGRDEIDAAVRALSAALAASRGPEHAPVRVTFYRAEVFVVGENGSRSRGQEECLWDGVLPPPGPGAAGASAVTLPTR